MSEFRICGTCSECKHWKSPERAMKDSYATELKEYGECVLTTGTADGPDVPGILAYAADAECMSGTLMTKPEFGCILWKARNV